MNGERPVQLSIMEEVLLPDHRYGLDDIHWEVLKNLCCHNGCKNPYEITGFWPPRVFLPPFIITMPLFDVLYVNDNDEKFCHSDEK